VQVILALPPGVTAGGEALENTLIAETAVLAFIYALSELIWPRESFPDTVNFNVEFVEITVREFTTLNSPGSI
jgi:hypothetical protein